MKKIKVGEYYEFEGYIFLIERAGKAEYEFGEYTKYWNYKLIREGQGIKCISRTPFRFWDKSDMYLKLKICPKLKRLLLVGEKCEEA